MRRRIPIAFGPSLFGPLYKPPYYRFSPFLCTSSASFCHSAMCGRKGAPNSWQALVPTRSHRLL